MEGEGSKVFSTSFIEVEVISHCIPGEPPKPLRFRVELESGIVVGSIHSITDKKTSKYNGNLMYQYRCEVITGDIKKVVQLSYERDTMKWFINFS